MGLRRPKREVHEADGDNDRHDRSDCRQQPHRLGVFDPENACRQLGPLAVWCSEPPVHHVQKDHHGRGAEERPEDAHLDCKDRVVDAPKHAKPTIIQVVAIQCFHRADGTPV